MHEILPKNNIILVIITGRTSNILENRARELGVEAVFQGVSDKASLIKSFASEQNIGLDEIAYISDDDNDLGGMELVAVVGCPADASKNVLAKADFISGKNGEGAVREFIEWLLDDQRK